jgi:hypothetical protein
MVTGEPRHDGEGTAVVERPEHGDEVPVAHDATRLEPVAGRRWTSGLQDHIPPAHLKV